MLDQEGQGFQNKPKGGREENERYMRVKFFGD